MWNGFSDELHCKLDVQNTKVRGVGGGTGNVSYVWKTDTLLVVINILKIVHFKNQNMFNIVPL